MDKIIHLKGLIAEDFLNYKKPSMFLITCHCDWKCCKEAGIDISICQNHPLVNQSIKLYSIQNLIRFYLSNDINHAIVFGGLEPFLQFSEIYDFIEEFRKYSDDDIVIYTGYDKEELETEIQKLKSFKNIIIKFGRYKPNQIPHLDSVLGVELVSDNQYAEIIQ